VDGDLVERRAARRGLQGADQLVQLAHPGVFRRLCQQGAADRAVVPERGQSAAGCAPKAPR